MLLARNQFNSRFGLLMLIPRLYVYAEVTLTYVVAIVHNYVIPLMYIKSYKTHTVCTLFLQQLAEVASKLLLRISVKCRGILRTS